MAKEFVDVRLTDKEVDNYSNAPYYKIGVNEVGNPKAFIATRSLEMGFGPPVYLGTWESNHSVVMKIQPHVDGRVVKYSFQSIVIPNLYLNSSSPPATLFDSSTLQLFERVPDPNDSTLFAYRVDVGSLTYYLKPVEVPVYNSQGVQTGIVNTIKALPYSSPAGNYHFTIHPTTYTPCP